MLLRRYAPVLVVVLTQLAILAAIPFKKVLALQHGVEVVLQTRPVDPYGILEGYYVTLTYEIEEPDSALFEPGLHPNERVWITVERAEPAWRPVSVTRNRPGSTRDRTSLPARCEGRRCPLEGVGKLYIPEAQRHHIDHLMAETRGSALVDIRVDDQGNAIVRHLRVGGQTFGD